MRAKYTLLLALLLGGCGKREPAIRHYQEIAIAPDLPAAGANDMSMAAPVAAGDAQLAWTAPEGWTEKPATGPRLATFVVGDAECSIVSFPGDTGGVLANLRRWVGQLGLDVSDEQLAAFAGNPEALTSDGGFEIMIFDFAALLPAGTTASMLAAIVPAGGETVFVKLTGQPAALQTEKARFSSLCRSLRPRPSGPSA